MEVLEIIFDYYLHSADFWTGVVVTAVVLWIVSYTTAPMVKRWNQVRQVWQPVRKPKIPMEEGPSPLQVVTGCALRLVVIALVLTIAAVLLWSFYFEG